MNYYTEEWKYLFHHAIDWETILSLYHPSFPTHEGIQTQDELLSFYEDLLTVTGKWTAQTITPRAVKLDEEGGGKLTGGLVEISEYLKQTYAEAAEMGLFGITFDPKHGGMDVPTTIGLMIFAQTSRACVSSSTQLGFFSSIGDMIDRFCEVDLQEKFIPKIIKGEISGSMCLTEPDAGSDVGALRTTAEKKENGVYLLNGTKCFITNGGGGLAFILARVKGAPSGLNGISMFFAEQWKLDAETGKRKQNYRITKIEDKMGMHGSPTCEVVYEDTEARLVGKENEGFQLMLYLMNEARISVGLQGLGGVEAALSEVRKYAEVRKQFGKVLLELPLFNKNFKEWETEQDAFRALMMDTLSSFDIFQKAHLKKSKGEALTPHQLEASSKASKIVRRRTPLVKYYGAELNALITQRAIQAFGGYGYMKEYQVERLHRDSFGSLLYEGTSQIQALMAMKDFVKRMMKNPTRFVKSLVMSHPIPRFPMQLLKEESEFKTSYVGYEYEFRKNVAGLILKCFKPEVNLSERSLMETLQQINQVFKKEYWQEAHRFDKLMVFAESLCQALSYLECLKVLSQHATKDPARKGLYSRYLKLVTPRFAAIYSEWEMA